VEVVVVDWKAIGFTNPSVVNVYAGAEGVPPPAMAMVTKPTGVVVEVVCANEVCVAVPNARTTAAARLRKSEVFVFIRLSVPGSW